MSAEKKLVLNHTAIAAAFQILAAPTRTRVLESLAAREMHVGEMIESLGVERTLMSHHLKTLRLFGLVVSTQSGKHHVYRITDRGRMVADCLSAFNSIGGAA